MKRVIEILVLVLLLPLLVIAQYNPNGGGGGSVTWPLTSPSGASISSTAGNLGLVASGTNQDITLTPSGTGNLVLPSGGILVNAAGTSAIGLKGTNGNYGFVQMNGNNLQLTASTGQPINLNTGTTVTVVSGKSLNFSGGAGGITNAGVFTTISNCASSASPAVCGSAITGRFVIPAAASTVTVNTTAVSSNSEITVEEDSSLGTALTVTCNTTNQAPMVSARTAGTSFSISVPSNFTTNPGCFSFLIVN